MPRVKQWGEGGAEGESAPLVESAGKATTSFFGSSLLQCEVWSSSYSYRDHGCQMDFLSAIASTSGRIHCEMLRLLFLHGDRETTRFFEIFEDGHARPHTSRFTYRRAAFSNTLKSKRPRQVSW